MANGLLEFISSPAGQGLLGAALGAAANAGRGGTWNTIGRAGLMGLGAMSQAQERALQQAQDAKRNELYDMQVQTYKADVARKNEALEAERRKRAALPSLFRQPGMTGGEAVPQTEGGAPFFSQPLQAAPMKQTQGGLDWMAALQAGYEPKEIQDLAGLNNIGKPKATRQMEVDDGRGGKRIALVDDFGQEVAGFAGYTAPVQVNQGDRVSFVKPSAGVTLPMNMSPEARASNALGWANNALTRRGQDLTDARARETAAAGKVPAGYRLLADGSMAAIPGGPADIKAGAEGTKRVNDATDVLGILNEVETLLPKATNSYIGTGVDLAARAVGSSTEGAKATGQLKALQGLLVSKMPKMSGPQSDKDVQLYREMAGQVGDPTIPADVRQAAVDTIRKINEKYAGVPEGSSKPKQAAAPAKVDYVWRDGRLQPAR
jgi:hypothetical protein